MPARSETHYFGAGPAPLPTPVLTAAADALLNYADQGVGVAEISHRSAHAAAILEDAKSSLYALLNIPNETYDILFLQGGGSGQFSAVVYHFVSLWVEEVRLACEKRWNAEGGKSEEEKIAELAALVKHYLRADYLVTGSWSLKASQEAARLLGPEHVHVALEAREHNGGKFGRIPPESSWKLDPRPTSRSQPLENGAATAVKGPGGYVPRQPAFTYYCDNETVDGVEFPTLPAALTTESGLTGTDRHVVADMSSNFLSRRIPIDRYAMVFAGAQKNLSVPGITIAIVRRGLLAPAAPLASPALLRRLGLPVGPIVLDYSTVAKNNSLYNTLPIFDVWVAAQVLRGLMQTHGERGIEGQEEVAGEKARRLYEVMDRNAQVFDVVPEKASRSRMNICLRIGGGDEGKEKAFLKGAEERGLTGMKGHRSVGGIRISNYNAITTEAIDKLVQYLEEYAQQQGAKSA